MNSINLKPIVDESITILVNYYEKALKDIISKTGGLTEAQAVARLRIIKDIKLRLVQLDATKKKWIEDFITGFYKIGKVSVLEDLKSKNILHEFEASLIAMDKQAIEYLILETNGYFNKISDQWLNNINRLYRQTSLDEMLNKELQDKVISGMIQTQAPGAVRKAIRDRLLQTFKDGIVSLVDKNGVNRNFAISNYAKIVAHSSIMQALNTGQLMTAANHGVDLVKISENPSTIGDFCDLYIGRVFSISGTSTKYPPLARIPNGGPQFHVNCKHSMHPFVEAFETAKDLALRASLPDWALLRDGWTVKDIIRTYNKKYGKPYTEGKPVVDYKNYPRIPANRKVVGSIEKNWKESHGFSVKSKWREMS
ncbi:phage minor capsid protein [Candidatus Pacearchaeota archaeon]|nr:phage minor capsid protein [Candidatus Pacearchaeota archaeon]